MREKNGEICELTRLIFYAVWKEKKRHENELCQKIEDMNRLKRHLNKFKRNNLENIKEPERYYQQMLLLNGFNKMKLHQ